MPGRNTTQSARVICALLFPASFIGTTGQSFAGDWTQAYIAGGGGADAITMDVGITGGGDTTDFDGIGGGSLGGTLRAGADYQASSWLIIGGFANFDWSNLDTTAAFSVVDPDPSLNQDFAAKLLSLRYAWALGGRLGVAVTPSTLTYGLLGYTRATFEDPSITHTDISGSQSISLNMPTFGGIVFGGGFEHKLTDSISLWGEYRHSRFEEKTIGSFGGTELTAEPTLHTGRLGVSYRFGGRDGAASAETATEPRRSWDGGYLGLGAGLDGIAGDLTVDAGIINGFGRASGIGGGDIGAGITVGYDRRVSDTFVAGIFGAYDWSAQDKSISGSISGQSFDVNIPSIGNLWTVGGRVGTLLSEDVLAYVLAGYSRLDFSDLTVNISGSSSQSLNSPSYDGVTAGGGFEKQIGSNLSVRAEYRYSMFEDRPILQGGGIDVRAEPDLHTVRLLGVYRFGAAN